MFHTYLTRMNSHFQIAHDVNETYHSSLVIFRCYFINTYAIQMQRYRCKHLFTKSSSGQRKTSSGLWLVLDKQPEIQMHLLAFNFFHIKRYGMVKCFNSCSLAFPDLISRSTAVLHSLFSISFKIYSDHFLFHVFHNSSCYCSIWAAHIFYCTHL